jgi:hypothetical protein
MVIDLPTEDIPQYVQEFLSWLHLREDQTLVARMHAWLLAQSTAVDTSQLSFRQIDIRQTPFYKQLNLQTQQAVTVALSEKPPLIEERNQLDWMLRKAEPVGKREMKRLEKEKEAMRMKYTLKMKPAAIAKKLGIKVDDVYKADQRFKESYKRLKTTETVAVPPVPPV